MKKLLSVIICSLFVLSGCTSDTKYVNVVKKTMPAVVEIQVIGIVEVHVYFGDEDLGSLGDQKVKILGSGVYVNDKGYILTCAHLFNGFKTINSISVINEKGDVVAGKIIRVGKRVDLAIIRTTYFKKTPFVRLADPRKLEVGQEVVAIGSPMGLSFSVTNGIISALYRDFEHAYNVTQSNTAINPGNSGGPLFNLKGELVGINSFMIPPVNAAIFTGLGFSVQVGQCLEFLVQTAQKEKNLRNRNWIRLFYNWA